MTIGNLTASQEHTRSNDERRTAKLVGEILKLTPESQELIMEIMKILNGERDNLDELKSLLSKCNISFSSFARDWPELLDSMSAKANA